MSEIFVINKRGEAHRVAIEGQRAVFNEPVEGTASFISVLFHKNDESARILIKDSEEKMVEKMTIQAGEEKVVQLETFKRVGVKGVRHER